MSKSRVGRKSKRRAHRGPRPKAAPPKVRDDFADYVRSQMREQVDAARAGNVLEQAAAPVDEAKAKTIEALKLSMCEGRNRQAVGERMGVCICGAIPGPDGVMKCRGIPPDEWFERLLAGDVQREAEDARRGDAASLG